MPLPIHLAVDRYYVVRDELIAHAPAAWGEAVRLCALVPAQVSVDTFWQFGRDKPCWSNYTGHGDDL